ncbi:MAG: ABC transporter permease, partial [Candidatus Sericytochromatia bacterium]
MFDKYFTVAFEALTLNKVRSALTMLGMIIGVLSVIVLVGLGQASQAYVTAQVQGLGSGLMIVMPGSPEASGGLGMAGGLSKPSLTLTDARAIESLPGVTFSSPASVLMTVVQVGENTVGAEVVGTTPEIQQLITLAIGEGRFFTEQENRSGARVAVIGHEIARELFKNTLIAPLGAKIEVGEQRFRVIGVLGKSKGAVESTDRQVLMPTRTFRNSLRQSDYVDVIYVKAAAEELLPAVEARMTALLRQRHGIRLDEEDDFNIQTQAELLAIVTTVTQTFTVLLAGIAAISLLVGGIGIMNIMLVSVTERTRE